VRFNAVTLAARPVQQPPELWIHGGNRRALRRAIRFADGWGPIVGAGVTMEGKGADYAIGKVGGEAASPDPYAELVARLAVEHPGIHVPRSKTYEWMARVLEEESAAIEARDRPLGLWLNVAVSTETVDDAPRQIDAQIARGATKIGVAVNSASLDDFLVTLRAVGERVLPRYREG
jgi:alkanesulfonate monooxygenase SsuD/methylene tetrahydromethanopterin reductase-like flavin-dependent oxidoreductase (luciferase family)